MESQALDLLLKLSPQLAGETQSRLEQVALGADIVAVPHGVQVKDLEQFKDHRDHWRGNLATDHIDSFVKFCETHVSTFGDFPVFINAHNMKAESILDYGQDTLPGHCRLTANLKLEKTALFVNMVNNFVNEIESQKGLVNLIEEYAAHIVVYGENEEGGREAMALPAAMAALRRMSVDTVHNVSSEQNNYGSSNSAMEKVDIKANGMRPIALSFTCKPYKELSERIFMFRISPIVKGNEICFKLSALMFEETMEEMALEFQTVLSDKLKAMTDAIEKEEDQDGPVVNVLIGSYTS